MTKIRASQWECHLHPDWEQMLGSRINSKWVSDVHCELINIVGSTSREWMDHHYPEGMYKEDKDKYVSYLGQMIREFMEGI